MNPETFRKFILELIRYTTCRLQNDISDADRILLSIFVSKWSNQLSNLISKYITNGHLNLVENNDNTYIYEITLLEDKQK